MINIVKIIPQQAHKLKLHFSDGTHGVIDLSYVLEANTVLTKPLEDEAYFKSCFIEFGALAWKNGLELSAASLQEKIRASGALHSTQDVA